MGNAVKSCFTSCEASGCCPDGRSAGIAKTTSDKTSDCPPAPVHEYRVRESWRRSYTCNFNVKTAEDCWNDLLTGALEPLEESLEDSYARYLEDKSECMKNQDSEAVQQEAAMSNASSCLAKKEECLDKRFQCKQNELRPLICQNGLQGRVADKCGAIAAAKVKNATVKDRDDARREQYDMFEIIRCMFRHYNETGTFEEGSYRKCAQNIPNYYTEVCNGGLKFLGSDFGPPEVCPSPLSPPLASYPQWTRTNRSSSYILETIAMRADASGKLVDTHSGAFVCENSDAF